MPRAKNRWERATQVLRWCEANWPIGRSVLIQWVPTIIDEEGKESDAETGRDGRRIIITLSERMNRSWRETCDSVIHEYVHGLQWPVAGPTEDALDDHPVEFWAKYGEIKNQFMYHGGHADAEEF